MAGVNEKIGYDELLDSRVKQLREVEDRVAAIWRMDAPFPVRAKLAELMNDLADMRRAAEEESAAF